MDIGAYEHEEPILNLLNEWIGCDLQGLVEAKFAEVPDALWRQIEPLIPSERSKPKG